MNILDYIILASLAAGLVFGIVKGFIKQIFAVVGIFVISVFSALIAPYVQDWFKNVIQNENTRLVVGLIVASTIVSGVYAVLVLILQRVLTKKVAMGVLNRVFGALISVFAVYLIFAVLVVLVRDTSPDFLPRIKGLVAGAFNESWIVSNVYKNNFFGTWIWDGIVQKLLQSLPSTGGQNGDPQAIVQAVQLVALAR